MVLILVLPRQPTDNIVPKPKLLPHSGLLNTRSLTSINFHLAEAYPDTDPAQTQTLKPYGWGLLGRYCLDECLPSKQSPWLQSTSQMLTWLIKLGRSFIESIYHSGRTSEQGIIVWAATQRSIRGISPHVLVRGNKNPVPVPSHDTRVPWIGSPRDSGPHEDTHPPLPVSPPHPTPSSPPHTLLPSSPILAPPIPPPSSTQTIPLPGSIQFHRHTRPLLCYKYSIFYHFLSQNKNRPFSQQHNSPKKENLIQSRHSNHSNSYYRFKSLLFIGCYGVLWHASSCRMTRASLLRPIKICDTRHAWAFSLQLVQK